jgi:ribosome-binding factor A
MRIELIEIIEREINDPRIGFITVTSVRVSPDLSHARVSISSLGDVEQRKKALKGLRSAAGFIRHALSRRLHHLRRIPELTFDYDETLEKGNRIEALLNQIKSDDE